ncbi:aryl-sulfate sulfotransferase N-terminal domain-containing protein [Collinsella aerofaciens]|uniref:aryl-sulfate sulfotransferase N-terminal domain-containing protein n=1 Tax=Collinsella aerofaciens TaxID=74426 RepID=UPI00232ABE05|nr:aryl-sulfate sulfotransferase N-terminal domain-containing protein [Collinsella aerofaciens]MDB1829231.1 aryl-sulfate sulfotransferase N-terminal domain-containing protein [Collinsella aerofaciens]
MAFKDGNDMELSDKDGRLLSRRAALAGVAGALAFAGTGLMGCSAGGAAAGDASTARNELTDEQKKLHKQIVATYDVKKQSAIKDHLDADYAAGSFDETAPFVKADPFGTDTLSCYVRFATADSVTVSYKVAGRKKLGDVPKVAAFSHTPRGGDTPATEHEFKVIGLIPNHKKQGDPHLHGARWHQPHFDVHDRDAGSQGRRRRAARRHDGGVQHAACRWPLYHLGQRLVQARLYVPLRQRWPDSW